MQRSNSSNRPARRAGAIGVVAVSAILMVPAAASAASVSGSVFNDFNTNGQRDGAAGAGAVDVGVGGLEVQAFDASGAVVATTTTAADGTYALAGLPDARVRIQLNVPAGYQPTRQLATLRSDERFVDASSAVANINFGVHRASQYSVDNPDTSWVNQYAGPARGNRTQPVIKSTPFFATQGFRSTFNAATAGNKTLATFGQVGTVFGLDQDQQNGDLYAGAFYKRFAGLTPSGTGAIFRVTQPTTGSPTGVVTRFADIDAGVDTHPTSQVTNDWFDGAKDRSWDSVGKKGLGSVKIDQASRSLYTVNLASGRFIRLSLDGSYPAELPATTGTVIPNPSCTGGDWRPFSVGINPADGQVYVGGICDASAAPQNTANLKAVVFRVNDPTAAAPTFTQVFTTPLTYNRVNTTGGGATNKNNSNWRPWPTAASIAPATVPTDSNRPDRQTPYGPVLSYRESYPQLTSLSFNVDGSLQLGMRDLMGDIAGVAVPGDDDFTAIAQGDHLRAAPTAGGFALESGGASGGRQGVGTTTPHGAIGPGGGYFYDPRLGFTTSPGGGGNLLEPSGYAGGLLQVPGFREVASTGLDAGDPDGSGRYNTDGVLWQSNTDGTNQRGLTNRSLEATNGGQISETGSFGKANGLGDLAAYTRQAPLQIGNRVWLDTNKNGVQDADETPIAGVRVELVDASCAAPGTPTTTTTDQNGEYVFSINPIAAGSSCQVRILLDQPALAGLTPTSVGTGGNGRIDSDGVPTGAYVIATVGPHAVGENDHSFDFGFIQNPPVVPPTEPPVTPPTPPTTPPTPPTPPVTPPTGTNPNGGSRTHALSIRKLANRATVRPGERIKYTLRVTSAKSGTSNAVNETLCDVLPSNLTLVSRGGGTLRNGRLCWTVRLLKPGQSLSRTFTVRVDRDTKPGRVINRATVTDLGRNRSASRTVRVLKRKVPKADSSYVTG